jgi:hypothetical protein
MNNQAFFRRVAAVSAIVSALLILAATVVLSLAVDFDVDFLADPARLIDLEGDAVGLFRWGSILELLGYSLFLIPVAVYVFFWLRPRSPRLVTLCTVFALGSILVVGLGAVLRASFLTPVMRAFPQELASPAQQEVALVFFRAAVDAIFEGLYAFDSILFGLWWLGIGSVLAAERRALGVATAVMGVAIVGAGLGWLFRIDPLARLEMVYFLEPFWLLWVGVVIARGVGADERALEPVVA